MYTYQNMNPYPYPYYANIPMHDNDYDYARQSAYWTYPPGVAYSTGHGYFGADPITIKDYGPAPYVVNINEAAKQNKTFRTALWTGPHLQVTLMSLNVGEDIGLEVHPNTDQFLRIEQGRGVVQMGPSRNQLNYQRNLDDDSAIFVPAGTWHNIRNTGNIPLKLYAIYAPPNHPRGTVHRTKAEAEAAERGH